MHIMMSLGMRLLPPLRWSLLDNDERFLPLSFVPFERAGDRVEPVRRLLVGADGREGIFRGCDFDVVTLCLMDGPRKGIKIDQSALDQEKMDGWAV